MSEVVTDELLEDTYRSYSFYEKLCEQSNQKPITFEEFVRKRLERRRKQMEELRRVGFIVK